MKRILVITLFGILLLPVIFEACKTQPATLEPAQLAEKWYAKKAAETLMASQKLLSDIQQRKIVAELKHDFKTARCAYKKTEFLAEYFTPYTARFINGAPIPEQDVDDRHRITQPEGFQVVEALLFSTPGTTNHQELEQQTKLLVANLKHLFDRAAKQPLADEQIFDAMHLEVFRVITLGLSGFDSPVAKNSIPEAAASLTAIREVCLFYDGKPGIGQIQNHVKSALQKLPATVDFDEFDRMDFIRKAANPLSRALMSSATAMKIVPQKEHRPLRATAATLFDKQAFNPDYYTAGAEYISTPEKTALGKNLFFDPVLSGSRSRSCASCHQPKKAFTDGAVKSAGLKGRTLIKRNTPTILNAGLQPMLFYDMRVAYLEDQATDVITNTDEMHGSLETAVQRLSVNATYRKSFSQAFPGQKQAINSLNLRNALGSYIRSLTLLNSRFDRYVRGEDHAMNRSEIAGFNLYMGKAKCGTCHFMPLFNGTVPPTYEKIESEIIGVPSKVHGKHIDPDKGRYELRKVELHRFAFRTPTIRNIALTAPYMHNGAYKTLSEVIDFYDNGGGRAAQVENMTLPFEELNLTAKEKSQIVSFLQTLTDTTTH